MAHLHLEVQEEVLELWKLEVFVDGVVDQFLPCPVDAQYLMVEDVVVQRPREVAGMCEGVDIDVVDHERGGEYDDEDEEEALEVEANGFDQRGGLPFLLLHYL